MTSLSPEHNHLTPQDRHLLRAVRELAFDNESADMLALLILRYGKSYWERELLFWSLCVFTIGAFRHFGIDGARVNQITERLYHAGAPFNVAFYEAVLIATGIRNG